MTNSIADNLTKLQQEIKTAEQYYERVEGSVKLLAASKSQTISTLQQAITAGQKIFGENYLQEALTKIQTLNDPNLEWHFIGAIQSNKTKLIAENFSWVHTVDRLKIAERLSVQRPTHLLPLNICIEVNVDEDPNKAGIKLTKLTALVFAITKLPNLKLRGLMAIPTPSQTFKQQRKPFRKLRLALEQLNQQGLQLDTLSMGMSDDFVAAIAEGATMIRIGTALFGERM